MSLGYFRLSLPSPAFFALAFCVVGSPGAVGGETKPGVVHVRLPDVGNQPLFGPPVVFSGDGRWLSLAGNLIDLQGPRYVGRLDFAAFSPDSKWAITYGVRPAAWSLPEKPTPRGVAWHRSERAPSEILDCKPADVKFPLDRGIETAAFSSDGKLVALAGSDGRVRVFEVATGKSKGAALVGTVTRGVAFLPDNAKVLTWAQRDRNGIQLWDGDSATPDPVPEGRVKNYSSSSRNCVSLSPDGQWIAEVVRPANRVVTHVVFLSTKGAGSREVPLPGATAAAFHPDGKGLLIGFEDGTVSLYSAGASGVTDGTGLGGGRTILACLPQGREARDREIRAVGASADGTFVAAVDVRGSVAIAKRGGWEVPAAYPADVFPTRSGTTWVYAIRYASGEKLRDLRLAGIEMFGDRFCAVMDIGQDQKYSTSGAFTGQSVTMYRVRREHWGITAEGVQLLARDCQPLKPPTTLVRLGLKAGDIIEGEGPTVKCLGEDEITVKAGTFKAIKTRVTWKARNGDPLEEHTIWFTRGVGMVKRVVASKESYTEELERFQTAAK